MSDESTTKSTLPRGTTHPRTAAFKEHLKSLLEDRGVKVSKGVAWEIFKDIQQGTIEFVLKTDGMRLPLSGVGTYEIIEAAARGGKAEAMNFVPRYRYRPSTRVDAQLEAEVPGVWKPGKSKEDIIKGPPVGQQKVTDPTPPAEELPTTPVEELQATPEPESPPTPPTPVPAPSVATTLIDDDFNFDD